VYAIASVSHPNFKLRWVPTEKKEWGKDVFITEAIMHHHTSSPIVGEVSVSAAEDAFFNFDDDDGATQNFSDATIECIRYLEDVHSTSISVLDKYPTVKSLFRSINATVPSSAPVERLFSKGALIAVPRRNRISDKRFEQLLLLKANEQFLSTVSL